MTLKNPWPVPPEGGYPPSREVQGHADRLERRQESMWTRPRSLRRTGKDSPHTYGRGLVVGMVLGGLLVAFALTSRGGGPTYRLRSPFVQVHPEATFVVPTFVVPTFPPVTLPLCTPVVTAPPIRMYNGTVVTFAPFPTLPCRQPTG